MSGDHLCDFCQSRPAAFQVKHPETSLHWRCLGCFRQIVLNARVPIIVFGAATKTRSRYSENVVAAARMTAAIHEAAKETRP